MSNDAPTPPRPATLSTVPDGDDCPIVKGSHVYLIDGSGYIFRAFHALPPLTRPSDGLPVGAVHGFCAMLWKLMAESKASEAPTHIAVIFDAGRETFRNDIYEQYKANRPPPPEELVPQFPLIRDAVKAFNVASIEQDGYEADDLIATYTREAIDKGATVTIVSSDKDLMQLVRPGVTMLDGMKNKVIGRDEVIEKFGVPPEKVVDVQSLAGDSVDNVPGVPGIGIKTGAELISEYGDLDTLLARASEIKQPKRREKLIAFADQARISRELVRLKDDVPETVPIDHLGLHDPKPEALLVLAKGVHGTFGAFDVKSMALSALPLGLAAAAQAVIVISGGIDLSIGALMTVANVLSARLMMGRGTGESLLVALLVLVVGSLAGSANGLLVVASRVPDIVVTLAMSFVWAGVALLILGTPGGGAPQGFVDLGSASWISDWVPNALLFLLVSLVVVWVPVSRSRQGLAIYAIGSDRTAAFRSGVAVARTQVTAYAVGGLFAALGGLSLTATTSIGDPLSGNLYTLSGVSAIVLGGVALTGGRGGILGPVAAAFVLTLLPTVLIFIGVDANYSQVIQGTMLVTVVMVGGLATLRRRAA